MDTINYQGTFFPTGENFSEEGKEPSPNAPLAERTRPQRLEDIAGQDTILGEDRPLRKAIERDRIPSMILWGPPGSGKTTLALLLAQISKSLFLKLSATDSGIKDLRKIIERAKQARAIQQTKTILFIDEIHRWNKSQQDALLPHVETGLITLIGATTENPSFEVNGALLSRVTVFTLSTLEPEHLTTILKRGLETLTKEGIKVHADDEALQAIVSVSHGDARVALTSLERIVHSLQDETSEPQLTWENTSKALQDKRILYDKSGEEHYNLISALHKSMRGSDPQGALYWLARMLEAGEDPLYVARRIVRFAYEDVGLADPNALLLALAARDAYQYLGSPEGELALAEAAVYLATAPKSNAIYTAFSKATAAVKEFGYQPTPLHIRNAPTQLMKNLGYGKGYQYAHDFEDAITTQEYLPDKLKGTVFYEPTDRGFEKKIQDRMKTWDERRKERLKQEDRSKKK